MTSKKSKADLQYFQAPELRDLAHKLYQRGGPYQKASDRVMAVIGKVSSGLPNPLEGLKTTNHGETRIAKCVKYDLTSACRLVTVQDCGKVMLLFLGNHEEEEKWLNSNRGTKFVVDEKGRLEKIKDTANSIVEGEKPELVSEYSHGKLYELLSESDFDELVEGIPRSSIRSIEELHAFSSDDDVLEVVEKIADAEKQTLVFNVLVALKENDVAAAERLLAYERGELFDLTDDPVFESERIYSIPTDDPRYAKIFSRFVKSADYKKWMLFMHPEQQEIVDQDFKGSAKLLGVSGSGKTCVVVKRAVRLAEKYPDERVLVVTLNRSLARLINELVDVVSDESVRDRIEVKPFFKVCQEYLHDVEPGSEKLYDDTTWKSQEHIDEIWAEYYRCELNNDDARVLLPVHDYLIAQRINAESYVREEFDWVRSALGSGDRDKYLDIQRQGRSIPMQKGFREKLLEGLESWEVKMRAVGVTDYLGLAAALSKYTNTLGKKYRCVLVDESQDFGTTELSIIRQITKVGENDLFICGDAAQRVSTKFQSLKVADISIPSVHSKRLSKNYRNSREILTAANKVLVNNLTDEVVNSEDFEVLDPEYSSYSGALPVILEADYLEEELAFAVTHAKAEITDNPNWKACIVICGYSLFELKCFGAEHGYTVLDGEVSLSDDSLFISDLEQSKGFEFDIMIVINAGSSIIPDPALPTQEHFRELCQFYVALTRAKSELIVSYHGQPSKLLNNTEGVFLSDRWSSYLPNENIQKIAIPKKIDAIRGDAELGETLLFMDAKQFLYSPFALGLSTRLIGKMREVIPGIPLNQSGHLIKWRNLGSAFDSIENSPRARNAFGSERVKEFRSLCEELEFPRLIKELERIKDVYVGHSQNNEAEKSE